jgi:hypothetical protein
MRSICAGLKANQYQMSEPYNLRFEISDFSGSRPENPIRNWIVRRYYAHALNSATLLFHKSAGIDRFSAVFYPASMSQ